MRSEGKGEWVGFGVVERSFGTPQSRLFCARVLSVRRGSRRFRKKDKWVARCRVTRNGNADGRRSRRRRRRSGRRSGRRYRYRYEETQWRNAVEKRYGEPQLETQRGDAIAIAIAGLKTLS